MVSRTATDTFTSVDLRGKALPAMVARLAFVEHRYFKG
jgi:hypothetical protein